MLITRLKQCCTLLFTLITSGLITGCVYSADVEIIKPWDEPKSNEEGYTYALIMDCDLYRSSKEYLADLLSRTDLKRWVTATSNPDYYVEFIYEREKVNFRKRCYYPITEKRSTYTKVNHETGKKENFTLITQEKGPCRPYTIYDIDYLLTLSIFNAAQCESELVESCALAYKASAYYKEWSGHYNNQQKIDFMLEVLTIALLRDFPSSLKQRYTAKMRMSKIY